MRRKAGTIIPIERDILEAALHLRDQGAEEFYGFRLSKEIQGQKNARLLTAHGTLYRALARLEKQGFLRSRWEDPLIAAEQRRPPRKFYRLTDSAPALSELVPTNQSPHPAWAISD